MSSVTSGLAQIPRNSHFRAIPYALANRDGISAAVLTFNPTSGVAPVLTNTSGAASGNFTQAPWAGGAGVVTLTTGGTAFQALSAGTALLKDMGDSIISAGRTFRRVQLLDIGGVDSKNPGTYTGADSDALCGYIEVGFRGVGSAGPFVRGY